MRKANRPQLAAGAAPPYLAGMKPAAPALALLLWPSAALAMNWEGHDDWMVGMTPEYSEHSFGPAARPLPERDCPVTPRTTANNPYEQIPLPRHNCKPDGVRHPGAPLTPQ